MTVAAGLCEGSMLDLSEELEPIAVYEAPSTKTPPQSATMITTTMPAFKAPLPKTDAPFATPQPFLPKTYPPLATPQPFTPYPNPLITPVSQPVNNVVVRSMNDNVSSFYYHAEKALEAQGLATKVQVENSDQVHKLTSNM